MTTLVYGLSKASKECIFLRYMPLQGQGLENKMTDNYTHEREVKTMSNEPLSIDWTQ
jgi:hypothetical protein